MNYPIMEHAHSINGVNGRMHTVHDPQNVRGRMVHRSQKWTSEGRASNPDGTGGMLYVNIRFDDECQNGYQSFSITGRGKDFCGCIHDKIAERFPELSPFIKWHLMSTDGPLHYIANTLYHASDRDCNGLREGETRQIRNGKTGRLCWILETEAPPKYVDSDTEPPASAAKYVPWYKVGEGKERDFKAARSSAIWPEATDEQLSLSREQLEGLLKARLPGLIAEFRADMERIGFLWDGGK